MREVDILINRIFDERGKEAYEALLDDVGAFLSGDHPQEEKEKLEGYTEALAMFASSYGI